MASFFASGSKSKLKRGINVTPYSLENLEISHWLASRLGFQEIAGSFQDSQLWGPPPGQAQPAAPIAVWGDQSQEEEAGYTHALFMMLIKSLSFAGGDKKLPHKKWDGGGGGQRVA